MVLAACDTELLGKTLVDDELEFKISEEFYGGEEVDEDKFHELLRECFTANLVGEKTIQSAKKVYPLQKIIYITDVPHAMIFKM